MDLTQEQIGANVMAQLEKLRAKKAVLEEKVKTELEAVNAEIVALERLAGLRKKPGKPKGSKATEKSTTDYIAVARAVLEAHAGEAFAGSEIAKMAIDTSLWENPPKSAAANMSRALRKIDPEEIGIYPMGTNKFYIPEADPFE